MMPSRGVSRIKLQRNSFRTDTLQPIKRKWTGSGLNPPADCEKQAQARESITNPNVVSQEQSANKSWNPKTATYFNGSKQDELDDGQAGRNQDINSRKEAKRQLRSDLKKEKRLVKHSCCTLCGDSKINVSPNTKLLRLLCRRSRSCHSKPNGWQKVPPVCLECPEYKAITRFDKHPVVNLCDVGRVFKIASRDFSCVLPAVRTQMKCQKVQCLKKEFRVPEHSRLLQIRMRRSGESWEVSTSTNSSASFLSGGPSSTATNCKFLSCTVEPPSGCVKPSKTGDGGTSSVVHDHTKHSPEPHKAPLIIKRIILNQKSGLPPDEDNYKRNLEDWDAAPSVSEKFSCQRTQGYLFIPKASCARTYKVWPFPRRGPPNELRSESQSRPRWITNSLSANPETFLSAVAPECCSTPAVLTRPSVQTEPRMIFDQTSVDPPGSVDLPSVLPVELLEKCRESPEETFSMPSETRQELSVPAFEVQHTETGPQPPLHPCKKQIVKLKRRGKVNSPKDCVHAPVELGSACEVNAFPVKPERADNYDTNGLGDAASSQKSRLFTHDQYLLHGFTTPVDMLVVSESFTSIIPDSGVCSPASISQTRLKSRKLKAETPTHGFTLDSVTSSVALTTISDSSSSEGPKRQSNHDGLTSEGTSEQVRGLSSSEDEATKDRFITAAQASETHTTADGFLDVSRAYHEDVLLLDVIQDDPDLFGEVSTDVERDERTRAEENDKGQKITAAKLQKKNMSKIVWDTNTKRPSMTCLIARHEKKSLDANLQIAEMPISKGQINPQVATILESEFTLQKLTDCNNKHELRNQQDLGLQELNSRATRVGMDKNNNGPSRSAMEAPGGRTLSNSYCRYYFNEFGVCRWEFCWYLHVPKDKDEKFCMEVLQKFCFFGSLPIVLRAVAVFQGYYSKCSPGVSYNQETVNHLLSCLLNFALLKEFREVVNLLLVHKRPPPPEIVLCVFELVMERGLVSAVPDLIHLASKVIEAGCVFSVVQCEIMQNHLQVMQVPRQHMDVFLAVKCRALASIPRTSLLAHNWVQAKTTVERLKLQEDWTGLAQFFCVCEDHRSPPDFQRFCCIVTMALLKDLKDKLSLPYEQFAESVCQNATFNQQQKVMLGRIGVSLIFKFHKMREWNKGVKLVKVMVRLQIDFVTLKGVMGNEQSVSRCQLVTEATELFLHSRNIEGALKMLQADDWFVSSDLWPCEQADLQNRRRVLTLLSEKTSHRDTFEILTNMPGLRQTINGVQSSDYTHLFNNHLRLCVMKQTLLVAADLLEFMLAHGMIPESLHLQMLVYKLAKQNNWVRARTVFKRAQAAGFYSAVVCERDSLFLPCSLNEIEMTLAFEMFITSINSGSGSDAEAAQPLFITLKRQADVQDITESMYLAAGSRLLSAALIPNPKLGIRYISASPSQEQLFQLDRASALKWFVQNQRWAQMTWTS